MAQRTPFQQLAEMLPHGQNAAFLEALREVPRGARLEDALYLALRKIGMPERQAHRMIVISRMSAAQANRRA